MVADGTKRSKQREIIFQVLQETHTHPTAEWVFRETRKRLLKISLGTIYRNLHILTHQKRIRELDFGEGFHRYDANCGQHSHFVCTKCKTVTDVEITLIDVLSEPVRWALPGVVESHRLDFVGICNACLRES